MTLNEAKAAREGQQVERYPGRPDPLASDIGKITLANEFGFIVRWAGTPSAETTFIFRARQAFESIDLVQVVG